MSQVRRPIPEIQWAIVRLSNFLDYERIATCHDVSTRTVKRIHSHFRTYGTVLNPGEHSLARQERKDNRHLRDIDVEFLLGTIQKTPDPYLDELREMMAISCGVQVSPSSVWRRLYKAGFKMEKITRVAAERAAQKRFEYLARIGMYQAEQLVFVDESSMDRRTTYHGRAWSIRGTKAQRKAFFVHGRCFSVIPALSLTEGILHGDLVEGPLCTEIFMKFIERLLDNMQPFPAPNSVIVMDDCKLHRHPEIQERIQARGMRCEFLPPHSPDLNPIEFVFSAMKHHLRSNGDYAWMATTQLSDMNIYTTLLLALYEIAQDPKDVFGWFAHCGYV